MNNLGYSIDNLHIGDTFIKSGDLEVDGDLLVGGNTTYNELSVNELNVDGYKLPTTKGNAGDIIVATTDGSTSQWQPAFEGNARIWQNIYSMTEAAPTQKGVILRIDEEGIGIKTIPIEQFPVNSCMKLHAKGQFILDGDQEAIKSFKIYHDFKINNTNQLFTFIWGGNATGNPIVFGPITQGHWELELYYTRINQTEIQLTSTCFNSYNIIPGVVQSPIGASIYNVEGLPLPIPPQPIIITIPPSAQTLTFNISAIDTSPELTETCQLKTEIYTIDLCSSESKILATSENLTTDHNLLSNLTLGDAGHTQFALLAGRDGGQVLSGGITPLHNLKLKSHSIGLDNVIIRDLKTEFKKDVDMDNNNISNANLISNTDGSIQYNTPSYGLEITTQNNKNLNIVSALDAKLTANNILDISAGSVINLYNGIATQMTIDGSEIGANIPVNMNSNNITNAKDIVDASTNNKIDMATGGFLNSLELSSADEVKLVNTTSNNFISSSGAGLNITGNAGNLDISSVNAGNTIQLNDPSLIGGMSIKSNSVGVLIQENSSTNNLGVSSGSVGMVCNSGQLNIRSTDAVNDLTIAKQNGGNINLDVQTGGGVVKVNNSNLDMNNNSIINASNIGVLTINNLTPVGGVSAGIVDGANITATTTETSLLPVSFIGSRQVPPNTFQVGDSYTATLAGDFGSANGDTLTIRLKGGPAGTTILSTLVVPLVNSNNTFFECEIDFCVRAIGVSGEMAINYDFSYNQAGGGGAWQGERRAEKFVFDTTTLNQLDITAQFSTANAANNIQTLFSTLSKTF